MNRTSFKANADLILRILGEKRSNGSGFLTGEELAEQTKLEPDEINDAVDFLADHRFVEVLQATGTAPFVFAFVSITSRGQYELEREGQRQIAKVKPETEAFVLPPSPVGSPYGFTSDDWKTVAERKSKTDELRVVFGCQFKSEIYNTKELQANLEATFQKVVNEYNKKADVVKVGLCFRSLAAGFGEHVFNEIAREIISADIAVFDTSDLNPNVMIEMGVALTWGVAVLPIKEESCPKPPSDISGQTWTDYRKSAAKFVDVAYLDKLVALVERVARKKGKV